MIQICPVVLLEHFNLMEGGEQTSKKHEAYCGSKRDSYHNHIEELPKYVPCLTSTRALAKVVKGLKMVSYLNQLSSGSCY